MAFFRLAACTTAHRQEDGGEVSVGGGFPGGGRIVENNEVQAVSQQSEPVQSLLLQWPPMPDDNIVRASARFARPTVVRISLIILILLYIHVTEDRWQTFYQGQGFLANCSEHCSA